MKRIFTLGKTIMLATVLFAGLSFTSCGDDDDVPTPPKKEEQKQEEQKQEEQKQEEQKQPEKQEEQKQPEQQPEDPAAEPSVKECFYEGDDCFIEFENIDVNTITSGMLPDYGIALPKDDAAGFEIVDGKMKLMTPVAGTHRFQFFVDDDVVIDTQIAVPEK